MHWAWTRAAQHATVTRSASVPLCPGQGRSAHRPPRTGLPSSPSPRAGLGGLILVGTRGTVWVNYRLFYGDRKWHLHLQEGQAAHCPRSQPAWPPGSLTTGSTGQAPELGLEANVHSPCQTPTGTRLGGATPSWRALSFLLSVFAGVVGGEGRSSPNRMSDIAETCTSGPLWPRGQAEVTTQTWGLATGSKRRAEGAHLRPPSAARLGPMRPPCQGPAWDPKMLWLFPPPK